MFAGEASKSGLCELHGICNLAFWHQVLKTCYHDYRLGPLQACNYPHTPSYEFENGRKVIRIAFRKLRMVFSGNQNLFFFRTSTGPEYGHVGRTNSKVTSGDGERQWYLGKLSQVGRSKGG